MSPPSRRSFRSLSWLCLAIGAASLTVPVRGQAPELERLHGRGYALLARFNPDTGAADVDAFRKAVRLFARGKDQAEGDQRWLARFDFALGLSFQRAGVLEGRRKAEFSAWSNDTFPELDLSFAPAEESQARRSLWVASRFYLLVAHAFPDSASTWNNLGQVYDELGIQKRAQAAYEKAVQVANPKQQAQFQVNYADHLSQYEDWRAAAREYARPALREPQNSTAHQKAVTAFILAEDGDGLAEYLWKSVEQGLVLRAQQGALEAVQSKVDWPGETAVEFLSIVAVSLSYQDYPSKTFRTTEVGRVLEGLLQRKAPVNFCASEMIQVHDPAALQPDQYQWWARRSRAASPPRGVWPREAFLKLVRSLASRARRGGDYQTAESYLELAVALAGSTRSGGSGAIEDADSAPTGAGRRPPLQPSPGPRARLPSSGSDDPRQVDPVALRGLVNLYVDRNELDKVKELATRYQFALLEGKAQAYRASELRQIYEYHLTLGELYSHLQQWGDRDTVTSAIFQLERARYFGKRLDEASPRAAPKGEARQLHFSPANANLLATAYERTGNIRNAIDVRLNSAEKLARIGQSSEANKMLAAIEESRLAPDQQARFKRAKAAAAKPR